MSLRRLPWLGVLAILLLIPQFASDYRLFQVALVASTAIIVLGLVVVTGVAGQVSLAQAGFSAIGAYGWVLFANRFGVSPWFGIPLAAGITGGLGYLLGLATLRLGGHYLALVTLAFTAIIQVLLVQGEALTGGALGQSVPSLMLGAKELGSAFQLFYIVVPVGFAVFFFTSNLLDSPTGRAWAALRQSEFAAQTLGIHVVHYKSLAFALSAALGALGGGLQALQTTFLDPQLFGVVESVLLVAIVVIGGLRSIWGAVLGSIVFVLVPELLGSFQSYRGLVFALLLLGIIIVFPAGVAGLLPRSWMDMRGPDFNHTP
ncbi:MAG: branched-chain amino acid ABC transporter permease [Terriglobales bacterium]